MMRGLLPRSHPEEDKVGYSTTPVLTPTANLNGRFTLMLDTKLSIGEHSKGASRFLLLTLPRLASAWWALCMTLA